MMKRTDFKALVACALYLLKPISRHSPSPEVREEYRSGSAATTTPQAGGALTAMPLSLADISRLQVCEFA